jgi:hypothetical protein
LKRERENSSEMSGFDEMKLSDGVIYANTLVFSNKPLHVNRDVPAINRDTQTVDLNDAYCMEKVINYSQIYDEYVTNNPDKESRAHYEQALAPPSSLLTGDVVQTTDYRGVGSHYVLWLHKDAHKNSDWFSLEKAGPIQTEQNKKVKTDHSDLVVLSAYDWGMDDDLIRAVSSVIAKSQSLTQYGVDRSAGRALLAPLLEEKYPEVLENLCLPYNFPTIGAFSIQYPDGKPGEENEVGTNWAELDLDDQLDEEGGVMEAESLLANLPQSIYPLLSRRDRLKAALQKDAGEKFSCYLFSHCDEMGYSAPTAVSIARAGSLPQVDGENRDIDLHLLPPPLDTESQFGRALHVLAKRLEDRRIDDGDDDGNDDDGEEEDGNGDANSDGDGEDDDNEDVDLDDNGNAGSNAPTKKVEPKTKDIVLIDFNGNDALYFNSVRSANDSYGFGGPFSPFPITRKVFEKHAELVRRDMLALPNAKDLRAVLDRYCDDPVNLAKHSQPFFEHYLGLA